MIAFAPHPQDLVHHFYKFSKSEQMAKNPLPQLTVCRIVKIILKWIIPYWGDCWKMSTIFY